MTGLQCHPATSLQQGHLMARLGQIPGAGHPYHPTPQYDYLHHVILAIEHTRLNPSATRVQPTGVAGWASRYHRQRDQQIRLLENVIYHCVNIYRQCFIIAFHALLMFAAGNGRGDPCHRRKGQGRGRSQEVGHKKTAGERPAVRGDPLIAPRRAWGAGWTGRSGSCGPRFPARF
ncbi:hypothetical protein D3C76_1001070 [compost metagenome]